MKYYAQLNKDNICIGISQLSGEVVQEKLVEIDTFSQEYIWKKYDKSKRAWSFEKYEPESTAPVTEFESLKQQIQQQNQAISDLTMMIAISQTPSV